MEEFGGEGREGKGRRGRERDGGAIQCLASGRHRLSCATDCNGQASDLKAYVYVANCYVKRTRHFYIVHRTDKVKYNHQSRQNVICNYNF